MASQANGNVQQQTLNGSPINYLYTDTGTYGTIASRNLTVYDYLGNVVETYSMGASTTQIVPLIADGWFDFRCVVVDNTGTFTKDVYYVAAGFYIATSLAQYTANMCGCSGNNCNLIQGDYSYAAALRYNLAGPSGAVASQQAIVDANIFVNQSPVVQYA